MILADTSAWVEFLRGTDSDVHQRVVALLRERRLATTNAVWMEVLVGAHDNAHRERLTKLLASCHLLRTEVRDYPTAADVHRICRRHGTPPRDLLDCLIASVAIRSEVAVLHRDRDFDRIAAVTVLKIA